MNNFTICLIFAYTAEQGYILNLKKFTIITDFLWGNFLVESTVTYCHRYTNRVTVDKYTHEDQRV